MKKIILFAQGFFGEALYRAFTAKGLYPELYTYAASATRRRGDREHLREGYPYRYINERSFEASRISVQAADLILTADWTKDFFHESTPVCPVYHLHPSLLPLYRGYGAVSEQFLRGVALSGLTLYREDGGIDTGPVLFQETVRIGFEDFPEDFLSRCARLGAAWGYELAAGAVVQEKAQAEGEGFYVQRKRRRQAALDLNASALYVYNAIRAFGPPYFGTGLSLGGKSFVVHRAACEKWAGDYGPPGTILSLTEYGAELACGEGSILLKDVEFEGKNYRNGEMAALFSPA